MAGIISVAVEESGIREQLERLAGFDQAATVEFTGAMHHAVNATKQQLVSDLVTMAEANRGEMRSSLGSNIVPLAPVNPESPQRMIGVAVAVNGPADVIGVVGSHSKKNYMQLVEEGRPAGKHPPAARLQAWAEAVLGVQPGPSRTVKSGKNKGQVRKDVSVGRAIAHAIATKGIRPSPTKEKSLAEVKGKVDQIFGQALAGIARRLGFK